MAAQDPKKPETIATGPEASVHRGLEKMARTVVAMVRSSLRDHPQLNRLVSGQESDDRQIALAMMEYLEEYNTTPPLIDTVSLSAFPSVALLIKGTKYKLLRSIAHLQIRNHMSYSDGQGQQVSTSDKGQVLFSWANIYAGEVKQEAQRLKMALNLQGAMNLTGIQSEYAYVNSLFDSDLVN